MMRSFINRRSVYLILTLSALVAFAYFAQGDNSGDTFAVGEVDIMVGNESYYNGVASQNTSWSVRDLTIERFFNFTDVKPDDYGEDTITLSVELEDTYLCADVLLTSNNDNGCNEPESLVDGSCGIPGANEGELAGLIAFMWWADDGDNVFEDDETIISSGPVGNLTLGVTSTIALADSDTNIWTGVGGAIPEDSQVSIGKAWCYGSLTPQARPQDGDDNAISPADDNNNNGFSGEPQDGGFACSGALLDNVSQTDSLTMDVAFNAVQAFGNDGYQCGDTTRACAVGEEFADAVVSFSQGVRKNGTAVLPDRSDPTDALYAPQSDGTPFDNPTIAGSFVSLGFAGAQAGLRQIVLSFDDNVIVDGSGDDLKVWEVTGGTSYPDEHVMIEVSQNGTDWFVVAPDVTRDATVDLGVSGLAWARFVRLTDVTNPAAFEAAADAYDLDAVSALNCEAPNVPF